jgi:NAD(P)-dependent dehydrogenase (short-subunit alcohol dehydrogenase family)
VLGGDMSDPAAIDDLFQKTVAEWGTVDVLVNNAGAQERVREREGEGERETARCRGCTGACC